MASIHLENATTSNTEAAAAAEDVLSRLDLAKSRLLFGFIPGDADQKAFHDALRERLPKSVRLVTASTTAGITNEGYQAGKLTVGSLSGDLDVGIGFATGLGTRAAEVGAKMVESASNELGLRVTDLDRTCGGIVLDDGSKMKKEEMLLGALDQNQGLVLVGGGASSDATGRQPGTLGVDGEVFVDGALAVLFRTKAPFAAMRHHAYEMTGKRMRITKLDVPTRKILEIDGQPAGRRWAELIGVPPENLTMAKPAELLQHAVALKVGREHFIRSVVKDVESDALIAANSHQEGQELELAVLADPASSLRGFFDRDLPARVFSPQAVLFFDCGARWFLSQMSGKEREVSAAFGKAPTCVGSVVSYETYCGFMVSSTLSSLAFGSDE